jgi:4-hydroxy-tetrahydrodipicolinate reductase
MKIVIVGYGRMGREIEEALRSRGHDAVHRVDPSGSGDVKQLDGKILKDADGIIEFALPEGLLDRVALYEASGKPAVLGTTGCDAMLPRARQIYSSSKSALLRGSNFSIGAHLFFRLTAAAARLVDRAEEYDVAITEYHHNRKADYPSGTALTAAKGVLDAMTRKTRIVSTLPDGPIPAEALQVASVRVGSVPGTHEMRMDSPADYLTIKHEARGRGGFALGAVRGLEWLTDRSGWYEADAFIDDLLKGSN